MNPQLFAFKEVVSNIANFTQNYQLHKEGCQYNGGHNCTAVCTDPALLFRSNTTFGYLDRRDIRANLEVSYNIFNCMAYPILSHDLMNSTVRDKYNLSSIADTFAIRTNATAVIDKIAKIQRLCYSSFCEFTQKKTGDISILERKCAENASLYKQPWQDRGVDVVSMPRPKQEEDEYIQTCCETRTDYW